ncbi:conserved hypothetical protein [delta proteobacterium NaphS2]|nr:conserved hypothetical protein [delta proteobacterium NaphS2]
MHGIPGIGHGHPAGRIHKQPFHGEPYSRLSWDSEVRPSDDAPSAPARYRGSFFSGVVG